MKTTRRPNRIYLTGPIVVARLAALMTALLATPTARADATNPFMLGISPNVARAAGAGQWQVSLGARTALLRSAGYDPFATDDGFSQVSLAAARAFGTGERSAGAVGVVFESGENTAMARSLDATLSLRRLAVSLEQRFAPRPWTYAFVRFAPGWLHGEASLADYSIPAPLRKTFDSLALDASVGAALRLTASTSRFGVWLTGDAGYGWAPTQHLGLTPDLPAADRDKAGTTSLGDLSPSGIFGRLAVALSY
jgi:hypothetical protein